MDAGGRRRRRRSSPRRKVAAVRTSRATTATASTSRPTADCSRSPWMATTAARYLRITGIGPGNNPPAADDIRLSPDGSRAFVSLQGKHYLVTVPRAGRETVEVRIQGRADSTTVPVKRDVARRRRLPRVERRRQGRDLGVGRAVLPPADRRRRARRKPTSSSRCRARGRSGSVLLTGARIITMKGNEVIPQGDVLVTDNRIAAVGKRGSLDRARRHAHHRRRRQDDHAGPGGRALAHVGAARRASNRGVAVPRQPRVRRDDHARSADVDAGRVRVRRHGGQRHDAGTAHLRDRARRVLRIRHRQPRGRLPIHQAIQGGVPDQHAQAIRRRRSHRPPMDHRGVQGIRHHRDHRRLARSEVEPDADGRRLLGPGTQLADRAALQGRDDVRGEDEDVLYADDPGRVRRAVDGELLVRDRVAGRATRSCASGCRGSCSTAWCAAARSGSCRRSTGTR